MKQILKIEIKRAFLNSKFFVALFIGFFITGYHFVQYVYPIRFTGRSVFYSWIGAATYTMQSFILFLLLPIIVAIPFGDSLFKDQRSGYIKNVCIRTDKKMYLQAKYIATFVSGGAVFVLPLLINLLCTACVLPSLIPDPLDFASAISPVCIGYRLFFTHPYLYIFIFLAIDFIFAGLLATIAITSTEYVEYRVMTLLTPFILYFAVYSLLNILGVPLYAPVYFLNPGLERNNLIEFVIGLVILVVLGPGHYFIKAKKSEVYE